MQRHCHHRDESTLSPFAKRKRAGKNTPLSHPKKRKLFGSDSKENGENFGYPPPPSRCPLGSSSSSKVAEPTHTHESAPSSSSSTGDASLELKVEEALVSMIQMNQSGTPSPSFSSSSSSSCSPQFPPSGSPTAPTTPKANKKEQQSFFHPLVTPIRGGGGGSSSQRDAPGPGPLWSFTTTSCGDQPPHQHQQQSGGPSLWSPPPTNLDGGGVSHEEMIYKVNLWLFEYDCCVRKIESDPQGCMESLFALMRILKGTIPDLPCFEQYHWWCFVGAMYYAGWIFFFFFFFFDPFSFLLSLFFLLSSSLLFPSSPLPSLISSHPLLPQLDNATQT